MKDSYGIYKVFLFILIAILNIPAAAKYKPGQEKEAVDTISGSPVIIPYLTGSARVEYTSGLFFVNTMAPGGKQGYFLIDFAAGSTVVKKAFLMDTVVILPPDENTAMDNIMGLGGKVDNYLGSCTMSRIDVGSIPFNNITVEVVEDFPQVGNRKISGVLGIDLLSKARVVSIDIKRGGNKASRMRFTSSSKFKNAEATRIPFTTIGNHIFLRLEINDKTIQFLFDTGSRESFIPADLAENVNMAIDTSYKKQFYGLDGNVFNAGLGIAKILKAGNSEFKNVRFFVPETIMMQEKTISRKFGILGNEFIRHFATLEVDFKNQILIMAE